MSNTTNQLDRIIQLLEKLTNPIARIDEDEHANEVRAAHLSGDKNQIKRMQRKSSRIAEKKYQESLNK